MVSRSHPVTTIVSMAPDLYDALPGPYRVTPITQAITLAGQSEMTWHCVRGSRLEIIRPEVRSFIFLSSFLLTRFGVSASRITPRRVPVARRGGAPFPSIGHQDAFVCPIKNPYQFRKALDIQLISGISGAKVRLLESVLSSRRFVCTGSDGWGHMVRNVIFHIPLCLGVRIKYSCW